LVDRTIVKDKALISEGGLPVHKPVNSEIRGGWGRWLPDADPRIDNKFRVFE